ncbi:unnamed protein product [Pleuronectes platessa]|uniref:Uncharacterized protein n=1 Tax=Pleuronectes platessa TaxID=8262 RepID=A0A9N7UCG2_PLEPL|nr:unnamed protein product [Pleuronectes platessa]
MDFFYIPHELKVPIVDQPNETVSFIKLLLSRCKKEFEREKEDDVVIRAKLDSAARRTPSRVPKPTYHKEAKIKDKEEPKKVQPQMDKKIQQVPWAQVIMVKGGGEEPRPVTQQYRKKAQEAAERCASFVLA